jgi:hypothetical protein
MDYDCTEYNDYISMQKLVRGLFDLSYSNLYLLPDHAHRNLLKFLYSDSSLQLLLEYLFKENSPKTIGIYRLVHSSSERG